MTARTRSLKKTRSFLRPSVNAVKTECNSLKRPCSLPKLNSHHNSSNDMWEYISDSNSQSSKLRSSDFNKLDMKTTYNTIIQKPSKTSLYRHVDFDLNVDVFGENSGECREKNVSDITASDEKSSCDESVSRVRKRTKILKRFKVCEVNESSSSNSAVSETGDPSVQYSNYQGSCTDRMKDGNRCPEMLTNESSTVQITSKNVSDELHGHKKRDHVDLDDAEEYSITVKSPNDRFIRLQEIGRGAFKTVYKGLDTTDGIAVAWCELQDVYDKSERIRFKEEVKLLKELQHPNIVRFYDCWEYHHRGRRIIVLATELMTSGSLKSYLKNFKSELSPKKLKIIKNWCRQILQGLAYMHSKNPPIIHRDLKCDNIFITGTTGSVKIGDLGLAILKTETFVKSMRGTVEFMAPEMFEEMYDEMVDVYSFGLCMLELTTGEYPYMECRFPTAVMKKVISGQPPDCYYKVQNEAVREIIDCCIRKNKEERLPAKELLLHSFFAESNGLLLELHNSGKKAKLSSRFIEFKLKVDDPSKRTKSLGQSDALIIRFDTANDIPEKICLELLQNGFVVESDVLFITQSIKDRLRALRYEEIDEQRMRTNQTCEKNKDEMAQSQKGTYSTNLQEAAMIAANVASNRFRVVKVSEDDLKDDAKVLASSTNFVDVPDTIPKLDDEIFELSPTRPNSNELDSTPKPIKLSHIKRVRITVLSIIDSQVKCSFETPGVFIEFLFDHLTFKPEIVGSVLISMITKRSSKEEIEKYKIPLTMSCINCLLDIVKAIDNSDENDRTACIKCYQNDVKLDYKIPSDREKIESINVKEEFSNSFVVSNMNVDANYVTDDEIQVKRYTSKGVINEASQFDEQLFETELQRSNTMPSFANPGMAEVPEENRRFSVPHLSASSDYQNGISSVCHGSSNLAVPASETLSQKPMKKNYLAELHQLDISLKQALGRPKQEELCSLDNHCVNTDCYPNDCARNRTDVKSDLPLTNVCPNNALLSCDSEGMEVRKPIINFLDSLAETTTSANKASFIDDASSLPDNFDSHCNPSIHGPFNLRNTNPGCSDKSVEANLAVTEEVDSKENVLIDITVESNSPPHNERSDDPREISDERKIQTDVLTPLNETFSTFDDRAQNRLLSYSNSGNQQQKMFRAETSTPSVTSELGVHKIPFSFCSEGTCTVANVRPQLGSDWFACSETSLSRNKDADNIIALCGEWKPDFQKNVYSVSTSFSDPHNYDGSGLPLHTRHEICESNLSPTFHNSAVKSDMKPSHETLNILDTMIMQQAQELDLGHVFASKREPFTGSLTKFRSISPSQNGRSNISISKSTNNIDCNRRCDSKFFSDVTLPNRIDQNRYLDDHTINHIKSSSSVYDTYVAKQNVTVPCEKDSKGSYSKMFPCTCESSVTFCNALNERRCCYSYTAEAAKRCCTTGPEQHDYCMGRNSYTSNDCSFLKSFGFKNVTAFKGSNNGHLPSTFHEVSCSCCKSQTLDSNISNTGIRSSLNKDNGCFETKKHMNVANEDYCKCPKFCLMSSTNVQHRLDSSINVSPNLSKPEVAWNSDSIDSFSRAQLLSFIEYQQKIIESLTEENMSELVRQSRPCCKKNVNTCYDNHLYPCSKCSYVQDQTVGHVSSQFTVNSSRLFHTHCKPLPSFLCSCLCAYCRTMSSCRCYCFRKDHIEPSNEGELLFPCSMRLCSTCEKTLSRKREIREQQEDRNFSHNVRTSLSADTKCCFERPRRPSYAPSCHCSSKDLCQQPTSYTDSHVSCRRARAPYTSKYTQEKPKTFPVLCVDNLADVRCSCAYGISDEIVVEANACHQPEFLTTDNLLRSSNTFNAFNASSPVSERDENCESSWTTDSYTSCHQEIDLLQKFANMLERHKKEIGMFLCSHHEELMSFMQQFNSSHTLKCNRRSNTSSTNGYYSPTNNDRIVPRTSQSTNTSPISQSGVHFDEGVGTEDMSALQNFHPAAEKIDVRIREKRSPPERTNSHIN